MFCLVASSLGHLRSQCSIVCGPSLQRGHRGSAEGSRRLAYSFSNGVWPARRRARRVTLASASTHSGSVLRTLKFSKGPLRQCHLVRNLGNFSPIQIGHLPIVNSHSAIYTLRPHTQTNTQVILKVSTTKHLGIILNSRLSAEDNVSGAANKAPRMLLSLKRLFTALNPQHCSSHVEFLSG